MRTKFNLKTATIYLIYGVAMLCLNECSALLPLSLSVCFAMLICGTHLLITPAIYVVCALYPFSLTTLLLAIFQGLFLCGIVAIYRRSSKKMRVEGCAFLALSLIPYIALAPCKNAQTLVYFSNEYVIKAVAVLTTIIFFFFALSCTHALLYKVCRRALKKFEILSIATVVIAVGTGLFSFVGEYGYYCIICCASLMAIRIFKSPVACVCAFVLGVPACIITGSLSPATLCFATSLFTLLFSTSGRFAPSVATFVGTALLCNLFSFYGENYLLVAVQLLLLLCACIIPSIPSDDTLECVKNSLLFKGVLDGVAIDVFKRTTSERLFRIADVFREIETAFYGMDENLDGEKMQRDMVDDLKTRCCKTCPQAKKCATTTVYLGFRRIVESGAIKGRVTLIDLPKEITLNCKNAQDVIANLNNLLAEYKRYIAELDNAKSGRALLATQAKGVCQVMKNCALTLSENTPANELLQTKIANALGEVGIVCPEVKFLGKDEICLTAFGDVEWQAVADVLFDCTGKKHALKDKIAFSNALNCYIFGVPPRFDATFGVATAIKDGETASGDTHSVLQINERSFMSVLSDGMGSGEYAKKVSSTAISLIEAFYKAQMPENTVINTINKLISFNRDERFACIDIAAVNLDTGRADFIKIGSPPAVVLSGRKCKILESAGIPLGILESLKPTVSTHQLVDGDTIIFMSDGITSAFNSTPELCDFLASAPRLNPQNLANAILAEAKSRENGVIGDDMTVLCTRIFER